MPHEFQVQGMTCNHCERAVTQSLKAIDPDAEVHINLASGQVQVQSSKSPEALAQAIRDEGYRVSFK